MNTKQNQKKKHSPNRDSSSTPGRIAAADKRKADNIRVLKPSNKPRIKTKTKINYGRIVLIGFVVVFVFWSIKPLFFRIEQKQEQLNLEKQLTQIKNENSQLQEQINYLKSNDYVEQKARSLGLSKPDEEVIVVVPQNNKEKLKVEEDKVEKNDEKKVPDSLWERIVDTITGVFKR